MFAVMLPSAHVATQESSAKSKGKAVQFEGDWTAVYGKFGAGSPLIGEPDPGVLPTTLRFNKGKIETNEKDPSFGNPCYDLEPDGVSWAIDFFRRDHDGRIVKNSHEESIFYLRDDFLMIGKGTPRPVGFFLHPESNRHVVIYRRGRLKPQDDSQTTAKGDQGWERDNIQGTWTKVYYESQGFFFSLANMLDLTTARLPQPRKLPFSEYIPRQWKITANQIEEGGERDDLRARLYAYSLNPEKGELDITPRDKSGAMVETAKREAVYFVKDDFLFLRYQIEPQRWRLRRPDRVFTSDLNSKTAILIFRRGPWKEPPSR